MSVFVRLSVSDIVVSKEQSENLPSYVTIVDKDGEYVTEVELYAICEEDENGDEI